MQKPSGSRLRALAVRGMREGLGEGLEGQQQA